MASEMSMITGILSFEKYLRLTMKHAFVLFVGLAQCDLLGSL